MDNYYETERKWVKTETYGKWVCIYCEGDTAMKFIATGHDHTDYHYHICDCQGAKEHGKPYDELV